MRCTAVIRFRFRFFCASGQPRQSHIDISPLEGGYLAVHSGKFLGFRVWLIELASGQTLGGVYAVSIGDGEVSVHGLADSELRRSCQFPASIA